MSYTPKVTIPHQSLTFAHIKFNYSSTGPALPIRLNFIGVFGIMLENSILLSISRLSLLSRSFSDHHLRCGGWLNLELSKREKHSGWAIKTIYKK